MCITAQCPDPTEVGIWWRDDASWKLYSTDSMRAILQALLQGKSSLQLDLFQKSSGLHPQAETSYFIDLSNMEQTNQRSGHKRAIKLILPSSYSRKEPSAALQGFMEVRIRMRGSNCLLVIHLGNIAEWKVDGELDAVVSPCCSRKSSQRTGKGGSLQKSTGIVGEMHFVLSSMKGAMSDNGKSLGSIQNSGKIEPISDQSEDAQHSRSVSAALHQAAGPKLQEALQKTVYFASGKGGCGDAVITPGFALPASHVVHTFAPPKYRMHEEASSIAKLEKTYKGALSLAALNGIQYIAFPAISCGAGKFPLPIAARVALEATSSNSNGMLEIHFVLSDQNALLEWTAQASKIFTEA